MTRVLPTTDEKPRYVAQMFGRIARRYDLVNTLMTFGQDAHWRRRVALLVAAADARDVLDVGTGTGRLADAIRATAPTTHVIGVDFTLPMLRVASPRLEVAAGDALRLPFANEQFDAVASAFVVRNLGDVQQGIADQVRVLRPGGLLVILETTPGPGGFARFFYRLYFRYVIPMVGGLIAGDTTAYTYLPESSLSFLDPPRLANVLRERGMQNVQTRRLALGSVAITSGRKAS